MPAAMRRLVNLIIVFVLLLAPVPAPATAQTDPVAALLNAMTPAEKVGQLFLVTFYGPATDEASDIARLITDYHVGGVVLLTANNNLTNTENTPQQILNLTHHLQAAALTASQTPRETAEGQAVNPNLPPYIPLFIGMAQDEFSQIVPGLTELPDAMAIGATWSPVQAEALGTLAGQELAALGINLYFGPALDVLDTPRPQGPGDLSTRVLGGDPFWVGVIGQALIRGLHGGSANRLAVVAKHFPGYGSADRDPDEEVPTVSKSLEQLEQIELAPFFSVTGLAPDSASATDALLTAHIRFRGFQGDLRDSTNPVSFDPQALGQLLGLEPLKTWRDTGGLTISDSLGVPALKRFPAYLPFNNRRIARDAFNAGNDILFLSEFDDDNPRLEQTETIIDTLAHFTQQYETQPDFAAKVDAAVTRSLTLKLKLYDGQFTAEGAQVADAGLATLGQGAETVATLAQSAATLIFPSLGELNTRQPQPPLQDDRVVVFTDVRAGERLCSECPASPRVEKRELERAIVERYGPNGSGEIRPTNLQSFSLDDLAVYLDSPTTPPGEGTPTPEPSPVEAALNQADWLVFNLLNPTPNVPNANRLTQFLARRPDLVSNAKIIVFSYSAPYYLDATDLSKLTAFYTLYSDSPVFVDVAAQLLFRELTPLGDAPVSVQSINYNLIEITAPDPNQSILLVADQAQAQKGDTLQLTAGPLRDHNGHIVPDQTPVRFLAKFGEDLPVLIGEASTVNGIATTTFTLSQIGPVEISADSEPAFQSVKLQLDVQENTASIITEIVPPTSTASVTPAPTNTPSPTPSPTITPTPTIAPTPTPEPPNRVQDRDFFMMCLGLIAAVAVGYQLATLGASNGETPPTRRVRVALFGAIGVLLGYNYFALGLPGADWAAPFGLLAPTIWVLIGAGMGLGLGWYWFVRRHPT